MTRERSLTIKLYRPVGLFELGLVWDAEMKRFPPRLAHQPIFILLQMSNMPVKKARDWNTNDQKSGYCGFVTAFDIDSEFLSQYELYTVGSSQHQEYWIPAKELGLFNSAIAGRIEIVEGYFGMQFTGFVPDELGLKGKNAIDQFNVLWSLLDYAPFDLSCETSANRKASL